MLHQLKTTIVLFIIHTVVCSPTKDLDRPVHEIINEQARSDDARPFLLYSNPLAGNSLQNAKLHAQHQQAMFNAERVRQQRSQIERWNQVPTKADSYMRAYHDLQETHQLELEKEQATIQGRKLMSATPPPVRQSIPKQKITEGAKRNHDRGLKKHKDHRSRENLEDLNLLTTIPPPLRQQNPNLRTGRTSSTRQENLRQSRKNTQIKARTLKDKQGPEISKVTAADAIVNRSHRSHGSLEYYKYIPNSFGTVQVSPAPDYDQGVYIKPNGNVGFANLYGREPYKLYSEVSPTNYHYSYPKQYGQAYTVYENSNEYAKYVNSENIDALQNLLQKNTHEQVNELNALGEDYNTESPSLTVQPETVYHYVSNQHPYENYQHEYAGNALNYANNYELHTSSENNRNHEPLNKVIGNGIQAQEHNVEYIDPNALTEHQNTKQPEISHYYNGDQSQAYISTPAPDVTIEQHTVNYYGQIATEKPYSHVTYKQEYIPQVKHESVVHYLDQTHHGQNDGHYSHNSNLGVQHLSQDGIKVSAYGDDNMHYAANYEFGYRVKDMHAGNSFGHYENKKGGKTKGQYHVLLPDGRLQMVKYTAGPGGYHAAISYNHLN